MLTILDWLHASLDNHFWCFRLACLEHRQTRILDLGGFIYIYRPILWLLTPQHPLQMFVAGVGGCTTKVQDNFWNIEHEKKIQTWKCYMQQRVFSRALLLARSDSTCHSVMSSVHLSGGLIIYKCNAPGSPPTCPLTPQQQDITRPADITKGWLTSHDP